MVYEKRLIPWHFILFEIPQVIELVARTLHTAQILIAVITRFALTLQIDPNKLNSESLGFWTFSIVRKSVKPEQSM
jgi:hypothetical protein